MLFVATKFGGICCSTRNKLIQLALSHFILKMPLLGPYQSPTVFPISFECHSFPSHILHPILFCSIAKSSQNLTSSHYIHCRPCSKHYCTIMSGAESSEMAPGWSPGPLWDPLQSFIYTSPPHPIPHWFDLPLPLSLCPLLLPTLGHWDHFVQNSLVSFQLYCLYGLHPSPRIYKLKS